MPKYKNVGGDSGVKAYKYGTNYIEVSFLDGSNYQYTYASAGKTEVEDMKVEADNGQGLNGYINKNVYSLYSKKW